MQKRAFLLGLSIQNGKRSGEAVRRGNFAGDERRFIEGVFRQVRDGFGIGDCQGQDYQKP